MEISISRKGDLQVMGVKGKIRLQNWRVLDKHLETMLDNGARWVAMDLSDVTLICSTGIGAIMHNVRKFQDGDANLLLVATTPYMQDLFQVFGCEPLLGDNLFADWRTLEKRLQSQGLAFSAS
jgi:anti-anti-sigma factor